MRTNRQARRRRRLSRRLLVALTARLILAFTLSATAALAQDVSGHPEWAANVHPGWPGPGRLFVGTCYQPVDRTPAQIKQDIALMHAAGFTLVRMGDLSWDAFEPSENKFEFAWFDDMLTQMHVAGIGVILDIGGLPAPIWLHTRYPSVNLVAQDGTTLHPAERYMVDISDPAYRTAAVHFADELTRHYAHNPAISAVGYDNEIGNGFMSYSAGDRARFIDWLKQKYVTVDALNRAWATQRWSRHLNSFDEVELPYGDGPGPPERYLDLRRFWSDVTVSVINDLEQVRERNMPAIPAVSNLWDTSSRKGFDYLSTYKQYTSYGAEGFYPGDPLSASFGALLTKGDLATPIWFNEFLTGSPGVYGPPRGKLRMWAYLGLIDDAQTFLAWTFNTHQGGEEQALFGLLDHDSTPSWKYGEFKQIATEFAKLEKLGFPRVHKPDVAIAYSFDSLIASHPPGSQNSAASYFTTRYHEQVQSAFEPFFTDNIDVAIVNLAHATLDYKLLVIPADYVMDEASAAAIRKYVERGGTALMTAMSAKVDEHSQWFATPMPGRLSDVFGLRTEEFYRPTTPPAFTLDGAPVQAAIGFYEVLEPRTAKTLASFTNTSEHSPAVTDNLFGKGHAIYVATPAQAAVVGPVVRSLYSRLGIARGPATPDGVYARVVEGRTLYVNTTGEDKTIPLERPGRGILSGQSYSGNVTLKAYGAELVE
jgi:beta-galactosidase